MLRVMRLAPARSLITSTPSCHRIVSLDSWIRTPSLDIDYSITQYDNTAPDKVKERIRDATIITTSATHVTRADIEAAPHLQLVACNGTGTDHVDRDAVLERGITVCHVPAQNTDSVSEHAFALYYCIRRRLLPMREVAMSESKLVLSDLDLGMGKPPRTNAEETLVVVGYGALGE